MHICISHELNLVLHIWDALKEIADRCGAWLTDRPTSQEDQISPLISKKSENYEMTLHTYEGRSGGGGGGGGGA